MATIEENAKAYTELINRLENVKDAIKKQNYGIAMDILCKPYPQFQVITHSELKESEDEKVKKAIFGLLYDSDNELWSSYDVSRSDVLAWLEKQAEHANFCNKIQVGDKVTRNEDGVLVNLSQLKRVVKPAENKGEHDMGISEATKKKLEDNLNKALEKETPESWNKFLDEQKPAEEYNITGIGSRNAQGKLGEMIKKLKPVNEVLEQKPAWSEEDEAVLDALIRRFKGEDIYVSPNLAVECLKSLKERYTWKPSNEQMNAINDAIDYLGGNTKIVRKHLMSLYEQLKKLKA